MHWNLKPVRPELTLKSCSESPFSGGVPKLFKICFALDLHRTAAQKGMPVPSLLIIYTPLKNITPDINPELVTAFHTYLYTVAETDLQDHQVVLIDQLLVRPPPGSPLDFGPSNDGERSRSSAADLLLSWGAT